MVPLSSGPGARDFRSRIAELGPPPQFRRTRQHNRTHMGFASAAHPLLCNLGQPPGPPEVTPSPAVRGGGTQEPCPRPGPKLQPICSPAAPSPRVGAGRVPAHGHVRLVPRLIRLFSARFSASMGERRFQFRAPCTFLGHSRGSSASLEPFSPLGLKTGSSQRSRVLGCSQPDSALTSVQPRPAPSLMTWSRQVS